jgi:hypothetical protein
MKKLLGILVLCLLLGGCDNNPLNSYFGNTVSRVEKCMKNTSSKLVSEEIIKNRCIKQIQEKLYEDVSYGEASVYGKGSYTSNPRLQGDIKNTSDDKIITSFVVLFFHTKDYGVNLKEDCSKENHKECEKILFKQKFNDQWIEPGKTESFVMKLIEENVGKISPIKKLIIFDKNLVSKSQSKDGVLSNWSWNITSELGLVIK